MYNASYRLWWQLPLTDLNPHCPILVTLQAFFQRWYAEQTPARQALVQQLVANGQLSFANGGWCMHDEVSLR